MAMKWPCALSSTPGCHIPSCHIIVVVAVTTLQSFASLSNDASASIA